MVKIFIQGLKDGEYQVENLTPVSKIPDMYPEFIGDVAFTGTLKIIGKRYSISGVAKCTARLVCDLSLNEFDQIIEANIKFSCLADNDLYYLRLKEDKEDGEQNIIHEDDKHIDLTSDVREELLVSLPMKRVAPEFRDKDFDEIYPEFSAKKMKKKDKKRVEVDDRWAVLKNIKID